MPSQFLSPSASPAHRRRAGLVGIFRDRFAQKLCHGCCALFFVIGFDDVCNIGIQVTWPEAIDEYSQSEQK